MKKVMEHISTIECEINIMLNRIEKLKRYIESGIEDESETDTDNQSGD